MNIYNYVIISLLCLVTFQFILDQTDLTSPESTDFSTTGWEYQDGSPKTTQISDCSTYLLKIDDQETIKKSYSIKTRHFANIELDFNLYFSSFVDNMITIKLNSIIVYQNTILLADITTSSELCSDSSSQHYQLTPSLSQVWSQRNVLLEIQYQQINGNAPSSYLGIRDIHILTDSDQNNDQCSYDYPLRSGDDNECAIQCKSVGEQIGGSKLNRCISPIDTTNIQLITSNWSNNVNLDFLQPDPNYLDMQKFQFFSDSFNQASYIIKDSATFESGHKIQVLILLYLFGSWSNGSYLKFGVNNGGSSIELFQITSSGTVFTVSTGATVSVVTIIQQDLSTISAGRAMIVAEGQVGVPGIWEYGIIQNLIGSTTSYAIANVAIYRAQQLTQLCTSFVQTNYCISCINPYYAYEGYCIKVCPKYSIISTIDRNCTSYLYTETTLRYPALTSNYIGIFKTQKFVIADFNSNDISSYFTSIPTTVSTLNYLNSQKFSIIQKKKLLGGYNSWGSGTYTKSLSGLSTHTQIRLFVTLYFIDNWYPKDKIKITIVTNQYAESIEGLVGQQITGNPALDYKKTVFYRLSHSSTSLIISFQCKQETNGDASKSSCGISDLYLMLDNVLSTTSTVCTSAAQYLDFYTNTCQNCDTQCNGIGCQLFPEKCKCDSTCQTCTGTLGSNCSSCSSLKHWLVGGGNSCICDSVNHYQVAVNGQSTCSLNTGCHYSCQKCFQANSSTHCSQCPTSTFRFLTTNMECKCQYGYYDAGTQICLVESCHYSCDTCSAYGLHNYCLTCPDQTTSHRLLTPENTCTCDSGFIDIEGEQICRASVNCHYSCGTCSGLQKYECITCLSHQITHRTVAGFTCPCDTNYTEIANNSVCVQSCDSTCLTCTALGANNCLTCSSSLNRKAGSSNNCICKDGYQDVSSSCNQIPCHYSCQLCSVSNSETSCITCPDQGITHRITGTNNDCPCESGYFSISDQVNCQIQCHYSCLTCFLSQSDTNCQTCPDQVTSHRIPGTNNDCPCETGYFSISDQVNCQIQCHYSCLTCSLPQSDINCQTCPDQVTSHRIPGTNNDCPCETGYLSISDQVNCQIQCHYSCLTCSLPNSSNSCLTCPSDIQTNHREINDLNECPCMYGYKEDNNSTICILDCHYSCATCSEPYLVSSCLSCPFQSISHRIVDTNNICICEDNYIEIEGEINCSPVCYQNCLTCSIPLSQTSCLSCDLEMKSRVLYDNQCICKSGYTERTNQEGELACLEQCHYSCTTCSLGNSESHCLSCPDSAISHRTLNWNGYCQCDDGYKDDGTELCSIECHYSCLTCSLPNSELHCNECPSQEMSHRIQIGSQCICDALSIDNNQKNCLPCPSHCEVCSIHSTEIYCDTCQENRTFIGGTCQCQAGYYENNGECLLCNLKEKEKCLKSLGLSKPLDYCDDQNYINRDGCSENQIDQGYSCFTDENQKSICFKCDYKACAQCKIIEFTYFCISCVDGYYLINNVCEKCPQECSTCVLPNKCETCSYELENGQCRKCDSNQGKYYGESECISKCGDGIMAIQEQCDDGNTANLDGCNSQCQIEQGFKCSQGNCQKKLISSPQVEYTNRTTKNSILLKISHIKANCSNLTLWIENTEKDKYDYNVTDLNFTDGIACESILTFYTSVESYDYIHLVIWVQDQLNTRMLAEAEPLDIVIQARNKPDYSEEQTAQAQTIKSTQESLGVVLAAVGPATILFGGFDIFFNILDILTWINNFYFLNVEYPLNVDTIFKYALWGEISFLQIPFELNSEDSEYFTNGPIKFEERNIDPLFINNAWGSFLISGSCLFSFLVCKLLVSLLNCIYCSKPIIPKKITSQDPIKSRLGFLEANYGKNQNNAVQAFPFQEPPQMPKIVKFLYEFLEYYSIEFSGILIKCLNLTYLDMCLASVMQIKYMDNFDFAIIQINYLFAVILLVVSLSIIVITIKISQQSSRLLKNKQFSKKYGDFYSDLNIKDQIGRSYIIFNYLVKMLFIIGLVVFYETPIMQCTFCCTVSMFNAFYLIFMNPFKSKTAYIQNALPDISFFCILLLTILFAIDDQVRILSSSQKYLVGWVMVAAILISILIQFIFILQGFIQSIKEKFMFLRKLCCG